MGMDGLHGHVYNVWTSRSYDNNNNNSHPNDDHNDNYPHDVDKYNDNNKHTHFHLHDHDDHDNDHDHDDVDDIISGWGRLAVVGLVRTSILCHPVLVLLCDDSSAGLGAGHQGGPRQTLQPSEHWWWLWIQCTVLRWRLRRSRRLHAPGPSPAVRDWPVRSRVNAPTFLVSRPVLSLLGSADFHSSGWSHVVVERLRKA